MLFDNEEEAMELVEMPDNSADTTPSMPAALAVEEGEVSAVSNPKGKKTVEFDEELKWYSLRVISGKEKSVMERIEREKQISGWDQFIRGVVVPTEKVYKVVSGKKVTKERNLLPGYILVEALSSRLRGENAKAIADIPNVIHFLGKDNPEPMTQVEANRLLGIVDESAEVGEVMIEPYLVGETVKITDGAFLDFIGEVIEVSPEKKKLKVVVKIFGRGTEMELTFMQVEKTN
jgi:transcription termination/antitermination protein NusG